MSEHIPEPQLPPEFPGQLRPEDEPAVETTAGEAAPTPGGREQLEPHSEATEGSPEANDSTHRPAEDEKQSDIGEARKAVADSFGVGGKQPLAIENKVPVRDLPERAKQADLGPPRTLDRPIRKGTPELTVGEKREFIGLLNRMVDAAEKRVLYEDEDTRAAERKRFEEEAAANGGNGRNGKRRPSDIFTGKEDYFWSGDKGDADLPDSPGALDALSAELATMLDANPRFRELLTQRVTVVEGKIGDAEQARDKQQSRLTEVEKITQDRWDDVHMPDPAHLARAARSFVAPDDVRSDPNYRNLRHKFFKADGRAAKIPLLGTVVKAVAETEPTRGKRAQYSRDSRQHHRGEWQADPFGPSWRSVPERGSVHWEKERGLRLAEAEIHLSSQQKAVEKAGAEVSNANQHYKNFTDIIKAAEAKLGSGQFFEAYGKPTELTYHMIESFNAANAMMRASGGRLTSQADYLMHVSLLAAGQYLERLDETAGNINHRTQHSSLMQLVEARSTVLYAYNRQRFFREMARIEAVEQMGEGAEDAFVSQHASERTDDGGVRIKPSGVVYYPDGTTYDPRTQRSRRQPRRRHADGSAAA